MLYAMTVSEGISTETSLSISILLVSFKHTWGCTWKQIHAYKWTFTTANTCRSSVFPPLTWMALPRMSSSPSTPLKMHWSFFVWVMEQELVVMILSFTIPRTLTRFSSCRTNWCCMSTSLWRKHECDKYACVNRMDETDQVKSIRDDDWSLWPWLSLSTTPIWGIKCLMPDYILKPFTSSIVKSIWAMAIKGIYLSPVSGVM